MNITIGTVPFRCPLGRVEADYQGREVVGLRLDDIRVARDSALWTVLIPLATAEIEKESAAHAP